MDPLDAYAPPNAPVADLAPPRIPGLFKGMLALFFVFEALGIVLSHGGGVTLWGGVMAIAAWFTLQGNRAASRVFGCFLIFNLVLTLVAAAAAMRHSVAAGAFCIAVAAYFGAMAGYIFLDPTMQAVFRKAESKKWSG